MKTVRFLFSTLLIAFLCSTLQVQAFKPLNEKWPKLTPAQASLWMKRIRDNSTYNFVLAGWGFVRGDEYTNTNNMIKLDGNNEVWMIGQDVTLQFNCQDGNFLYKSHIDGARIYFSDRTFINDELEIISKDPSFQSWMELVSVAQENGATMFFTVDSLGVYRIFYWMKKK